MNQSIRIFGQHVIVELTTCSVNGELTADGACLRFAISARTTPLSGAEEATFLTPLRAVVHVEYPTPLRLGNAVLDAVVPVPTVPNDTSLWLSLPMTDNGLARLDELRAGQPLRIWFDLAFLTQRPGGELTLAEGRYRHTITRDDWEQLARTLRLEAPVVFELPRPPNAALGHFQAAARARREARPADVLVHARKALEAVGLGRPKNLPKSAKTVFSPEETREWSVDARVAVAVEALRILLHTGAHPPERSPTLGEAVFALTATAGALKLREGLQSEPEDG